VPIRIIIADDHPIILDGLVHLFTTANDIDVVTRCSDGEEALGGRQGYAACPRRHGDVPCKGRSRTRALLRSSLASEWGLGGARANYVSDKGRRQLGLRGRCRPVI